MEASHGAQVTIVILLTIGMLVNLHHDFNGREAREPYGFWGGVVTLFFYAALALLYFKAGAFSTFF